MADMAMLIVLVVLLLMGGYSEALLPTSTISAAPALLPSSPSVSSPSPTLSPDITPLFPSPYGGAPSPSDSSSLPTIPSSPSTPNPDDVFAPGPSMGISPSGSPLSSSSTVGYGLFGSLSSAIFMSLVVLWLMQLSGM